MDGILNRLVSDKEMRVLECLFRAGEMMVSGISRETLLNRTALYHTLTSLLQKGLVTQVKKNKISYYQSITLDQFKQWNNLHVKYIQEQSNKDIERLKALRIRNNQSLYADVKYFEGMEGMKSLYADTLYNNKERMIYSITDYEGGYGQNGDWFDSEYLPTRVRLGIKVKTILQDTPFGRNYIKSAKEMLRDMNFIQLSDLGGIEICIYDSKIALVVFDAKHPIGIIIQNPIMAHAFKSIFDYIWKTGKKLK